MSNFMQQAQSAKTVTWKRGSATNREMKPFSPKRERDTLKKLGIKHTHKLKAYCFDYYCFF